VSYCGSDIPKLTPRVFDFNLQSFIEYCVFLFKDVNWLRINIYLSVVQLCYALNKNIYKVKVRLLNKTLRLKLVIYQLKLI